MDDKKQQEAQPDDPGLRQGRADSYAGFVSDDQAGTSSIGSGDRQSGIHSNFAKASPESNVGPAGAAQSSHGNASGPIPGGVLGKAEDGQDGQSAIGEQLADGAESSGTPGDGPR